MTYELPADLAKAIKLEALNRGVTAASLIESRLRDGWIHEDTSIYAVLGQLVAESGNSLEEVAYLLWEMSRARKFDLAAYIRRLDDRAAVNYMTAEIVEDKR